MRSRNQNDLGNKKRTKPQQQLHRGICKKICYEIYDVTFPLYLYQWGSSNVSSFVYFLRNMSGKWREFVEEQQAQNAKKYDTRAES